MARITIMMAIASAVALCWGLAPVDANTRDGGEPQAPEQAFHSEAETEVDRGKLELQMARMQAQLAQLQAHARTAPSEEQPEEQDASDDLVELDDRLNAERHLAALEESFETGDSDPDFEASTSEAIAGLIEQFGEGQTAVDSVECTTSMCRVVVATTPEQASELSMNLAVVPDLPRASIEPHEEGEQVILTAYYSREG